ncbi:hypothetical protein [Nocardia sp. alder85J]|uniref:hypothetical protein n=1 Tax=Nocardia sp. alder85J TaxID=2862949 RepID=UPI001CD58F6B|nr:hypothetical protein [Nocardia sp. alder85J]MCX4094761.1 hypothetical protein [Nocardia sp. alder85J]
MTDDLNRVLARILDDLRRLTRKEAEAWGDTEADMARVVRDDAAEKTVVDREGGRAVEDAERAPELDLGRSDGIPEVVDETEPFRERVDRMHTATTRLAELDDDVESALFDAELADVTARDAELSAGSRFQDWFGVKMQSFDWASDTDPLALDGVVDDMWHEVGDAYDRAADAHREAAGMWRSAQETVQRRNSHKAQLVDDFTTFVDDATARSSGNPSWVRALREGGALERVVADREASYCTERSLWSEENARRIGAQRTEDIVRRTVLEQQDRGESAAAADDVFGQIIAGDAAEVRLGHEATNMAAQTEFMLSSEARRDESEKLWSSGSRARNASEQLKQTLGDLRSHDWRSPLGLASSDVTDTYLTALTREPIAEDGRPQRTVLTSVLTGNVTKILDALE